MKTFVAQMSFTWLALFPILNPPAMAPVFLTLTSAVSDRDRNRLAFRIGAYTALFLTVLLLVGGWILKDPRHLHPVVAIAGGILLFHSAWHMLNKDPRVSEKEEAEIRSSMENKAFFPLTMPVTAGPGSMAVTLSLVPRGSILEPSTLLAFLATACGLVLAGATVFVFYRFSGPVIRRLGDTGRRDDQPGQRLRSPRDRRPDRLGRRPRAPPGDARGPCPRGPLRAFAAHLR